MTIQAGELYRLKEAQTFLLCLCSLDRVNLGDTKTRRIIIVPENSVLMILDPEARVLNGAFTYQRSRGPIFSEWMEPVITVLWDEKILLTDRRTTFRDTFTFVEKIHAEDTT